MTKKQTDKIQEIIPQHDGFKEFPKMLYFKGDVANQKQVDSAEEEAELGDDWIDAPVDPLAKPMKK